MESDSVLDTLLCRAKSPKISRSDGPLASTRQRMNLRGRSLGAEAPKNLTVNEYTVALALAGDAARVSTDMLARARQTGHGTSSWWLLRTYRAFTAKATHIMNQEDLKFALSSIHEMFDAMQLKSDDGRNGFIPASAWFDNIDGTTEGLQNTVGRKRLVLMKRVDASLSANEFRHTFVHRVRWFWDLYLREVVMAVAGLCDGNTSEVMVPSGEFRPICDMTQREYANILKLDYGLYDECGSFKMRFELVQKLAMLPPDSDIGIELSNPMSKVFEQWEGSRSSKVVEQLKRAGLLDPDVRRMMHDIWGVEEASTRLSAVYYARMDWLIHYCQDIGTSHRFRFSTIIDFLRIVMWPQYSQEASRSSGSKSQDFDTVDMNWIPRDKFKRGCQEQIKLCNRLGVFVYQFPIVAGLNASRSVFIRDLEQLHATMTVEVNSANDTMAKLLSVFLAAMIAFVQVVARFAVPVILHHTENHLHNHFNATGFST